jgi:hypothetical protein
MEPSLDRRNDESERVPLRLEVELGQGDFQDAFAADSLNLSKGGISMRGPCLPDIGSRLLLRFQCLPSGAVVTAQGEVVWAHLEGENSGEFGLSFVDLDPSSEWLIEEMLAEHAPQGAPHPPAEEASAKVATLELEGSSAAIAARVASADAGQAVFEQDLELLRLGRPVRAQAAGEHRRRGSIAGVELRMVGSVPMLAVTVMFHDHAPPGLAPAVKMPELEPEPVPVPEPVAEATMAQAHDTEPDLVAPLALAAEPPPPRESALGAQAGAPHTTLTEFEAEPSVQPVEALEPQPEPRQQPARQLAERASEPAEVVPRPPPMSAPRPPPMSAPRPPPMSAPRPPPMSAPRPPRPPEFESAAGRDYSTSFVLPQRDDELECVLEEMTAPAWKPAVTSALRVIGEQALLLLGFAGRAADAGYRKAMPQVRLGLLRSRALVRGVYALRLAPQLGALRRLASTHFGLRRRRTTGRPGVVRQSSALGRTLLLGVLGAGATALGVYALVPGGDAEIELHRPLRAAAAPAAAGAQPAPVSAAELEPAASAAPDKATPARGAAPVTPDPNKLPSARQVPAGSPFAVDVRPGGTPARAEAASKAIRFGAASVPRARRFTLRMSGRVQGLQGASDPGGFSVTVLGALSLDRAGPISSAHRAVARSMIINKGDRAELNIRFADGKRPAYQVSADGNTLHVLIQDG